MSYKLNNKKITQLAKIARDSAEKTAFSILDDVEQEQTVPFLTGYLNQTADVKPYGTGFQIIYSTPYAARQYYVPMNHTKTHHAHATDHWLDPYLSNGYRYRWVQDVFSKHYRKELDKYGGE